MHLDFAFVSHFRAMHTMSWAVLLSLLIVGLAATLGRATLRLRGALTDEDGTLAVMMLLPEEHITDVTLIKATANEQEFLTETDTGPKLVRLKKDEDRKWIVEDEVNLHE